MGSKIPFYNIVNMLLIGLVFIGILLTIYISDVMAFFCKVEITTISTLPSIIISFSFFAIIYEVGLIINRLGSLLEDILKLAKLIPFDNDYKKFNERKREFPIMSTLSREYSLSRTSMILFLLISIVTFCKLNWWGLIPVSIFVLFFFSCRKYAQKIIDLMK